MCCQQNRLSGDEPVRGIEECIKHELLRVGIQRTKDVVEHEAIRLGVHGACERHALALPARQLRRQRHIARGEHREIVVERDGAQNPPIPRRIVHGREHDRAPDGLGAKPGVLCAICSGPRVRHAQLATHEIHFPECCMQECRFAAADMADDHRELVVRDAGRQLVQEGRVAVSERRIGKGCAFAGDRGRLFFGQQKRLDAFDGLPCLEDVCKGLAELCDGHADEVDNSNYSESGKF